nr:MAG TPA: hypothetical protein [Caudoviricetes sp.]
MKNLYWKRIYMNMNDGKEPILNWDIQLVYCHETPTDTREEVKDKTDLVVKIVSGHINGCIKRSIFDRSIKKIHIENMRYYTREDYKPEKINFPIFRETTYKPLDYNMSFKRLSEELSAEDFIRWMKDNGMNTCPIMK